LHTKFGQHFTRGGGLMLCTNCIAISHFLQHGELGRWKEVLKVKLRWNLRNKIIIFKGMAGCEMQLANLNCILMWLLGNNALIT
jgi:hypothetical protein